MTKPAGGGLVTIDLQAAQSPGYRDRGVARYALDFTKSVVEAHPGLIGQVLLNPDLPPVVGCDQLLARARVVTTPEWEHAGGIFHVLSPFDLDIPLPRLWPREVSQRGLRLVVTVYDLIPQLFADLYLADPGQRRRYRARCALVRAADHVMTLSASAAHDVKSCLGVPEQRITVVGAAPGEAFRPPECRERALAAARALVPGLDARFVVYNGAVEPRKNMDRLVEAFAQLPGELRRGWQLVLVCRLKATERHHYEVRSQQLGIEGRLLLTGYVPDDTLARLYQAAGLVVYPSLYEGYGLPVAEALACGAPVIASRNSSLIELVDTEATFDPLDIDAISTAMSRALSDRSHRDRLLAWAASPRPTWQVVAGRAAAVYEELDDRRAHRGAGGPEDRKRVDGPDGRAWAPASVGGRGATRWRPRPLLAMVTPWPPATSGVAIYSARMVEALSSYVDVEVYVDEGQGDGRTGFDPRVLPVRDRALGGYDAILLCLGNSEFHAQALRLLRVVGVQAVVQAHDVRLTNLYLHGASRGAVPEGFAELLERLYPQLGGLLRDGQSPGEVADRHGVLMVREIAALAQRVLTTSPFAARLARLDCHPSDGPKVGIWPFAYPAAVERPAAGIDPGLVCSFGLVNPAKSPDLLVEAFAGVARSHPAAKLAFVGPIGVEESGRLQARCSEMGIWDRISFTGHLDDASYHAWMARAGIAVQLRDHSNGETSAAVADCLAHGVATLATSAGPSSELPDFVEKVRPGASPGELAAAISALLDAPDRRATMGLQSRAYVRRHSFDWAARQLIDLIPALRRTGQGRP